MYFFELYLSAGALINKIIVKNSYYIYLFFSILTIILILFFIKY
jgi:hypothetical protein